jgi:hypothetical protein
MGIQCIRFQKHAKGQQMLLMLEAWASLPKFLSPAVFD